MESIKAYKVFNNDWTCRNFKYEIGKTYTHGGEIGLCSAGFHACEKVSQCFSYYSFDSNNKIAEVELSGDIIRGDNKIVASQIRIVRELRWEEMLVLANTGINNSGHSNSGHSNSGNWNSGHSNSGHSNSGDRNSGNCNSGNWNSGDWNSGFFNSNEPESIRVFNKKCKKEDWDNAEKPDFIYNLILLEWVYADNMTVPEKNANPNWLTTGGYLKKYSFKEAWQRAYKSASKQDIELLKALPNFNAKIFKKITGIEV